MACCAFALFVVGQIAACFVAIGRTLGLSGGHDGAPPPNPATTWQLHAASLAAPAPRAGGRRRVAALPVLALVAILELGLLATGVTWLRGSSPDAAWTDTAWCRGAASLVDDRSSLVDDRSSLVDDR